MTRRKSRAKRRSAPTRTAAPAAQDPVADIDAFLSGAPPASAAAAPLPPAELRERALAASTLALLAKAESGKALTRAEMDQVDRYVSTQTPAPAAVEPAPPAGAPLDLQCASYDAMAQALGITSRTIYNWRRDGISIAGDPPYSLRAFCQEVKAARKLRSCRPQGSIAQAVWAAALAEGAAGAEDPNEPLHDAPTDWAQEKERQEALRTTMARKLLEQEYEAKAGHLVPAEAVRETLVALRTHVVARLQSVLHVPSRLGALSVETRAALAEALQGWVQEVRQGLASDARGHATTLREAAAQPEKVT